MSVILKYNLLDGEIEFGSSIVEYGKLKKEFVSYTDELADFVGEFYNNNKETIMDGLLT